MKKRFLKWHYIFIPVTLATLLLFLTGSFLVFSTTPNELSPPLSSFPPQVRDYPPAPTHILKEVASWPRFENISGWSMSYPKELKVGGCCYHTAAELAKLPFAFVGFYPPTTQNDRGWVLVEHLRSKSPDVSVEYHLAEIALHTILPPHLIEEKITFQGLPALRVVWRSLRNGKYEGPWQEDIFVVFNDTDTFSFSFNPRVAYPTLEEDPNYRKYQQMLRTFTYIPSVKKQQ